MMSEQIGRDHKSTCKLTEEELRQLWLAGTGEAEMCRQTGMTGDGLRGKIARLRAKEGEERWPRRRGIIQRRQAIVPSQRPAAVPRVGKVSLPPLPSLQDAVD